MRTLTCSRPVGAAAWALPRALDEAWPLPPPARWGRDPRRQRYPGHLADWQCIDARAAYCPSRWQKEHFRATIAARRDGQTPRHRIHQSDDMALSSTEARVTKAKGEDYTAKSGP